MRGRSTSSGIAGIADLPTDYAGLVAMCPPRPLHDAGDARQVEEIVLEMAGHRLSVDQEDYLEVMSDLLLKYAAKRERRRARRGGRTPAARLAFVMSESGTTPAGLARVLGCSQPLVSLLLAGKRQLTVGHVRKLAGHYRLAGDYFL